AQMLDAYGVGSAQILDECQHLLLRGRREIPLYIELSNRLAEVRVEAVHSTLPALLLLRLTAERMPVEGEIFLIECLWQDIGNLGEIVVLEVGSPALDRNLPEQFCKTLHGVQFANDERLTRVEPLRRKQRPPWNAARELLELGAGAQVIGQVALAALGRGPVESGDARLDVQDGAGVGWRGLCAGELEHARDVGRVLRAQIGEYRLVLEVIVAIGQTQSALADGRDITIRILLIDRDQQPQRRPQGQVAPTHEPSQVLVGAR